MNSPEGISVSWQLYFLVMDDSGRIGFSFVAVGICCGVGFQPGDKGDFLFVEVAIPAVVCKASIKDDTGSGRKVESSRPINLMLFAGSQVHEHREMAICIKTKVEFNRALGPPESSPGKKSKAKLDGGGIEEIDLSLEPELMLGCTRLASL
jgi:hypothetical protein